MSAFRSEVTQARRMTEAGATAEEIAWALGVSARTVVRWRSSGFSLHHHIDDEKLAKVEVLFDRYNGKRSLAWAARQLYGEVFAKSVYHTFPSYVARRSAIADRQVAA